MGDFSQSLRCFMPWRKIKISYLSLLAALILIGLLARLIGITPTSLIFQSHYPVIVWWTPFTPFKRIDKSCSKGKCTFVKDRQEISNPLTEAVLFYGTDFKWTDLPLPRNNELYWSLFHEESPKNNWGFAYKAGISVFNITSTFSRYSDYPLVTQSLESIESLLTPVKYTTTQKSAGELGLVMYLQSDCGTPSDRDSYVTELMNYVKVDSYGKCLHNKDLPVDLINPITGMDSPRLKDIIGRYKFVLAFENAICEDYVTEKLWRSFQAGSVPVYKGSPSIKDWAPSNHSVILIDDFASPKKLGEHLNLLDKNDEEYNKYLSYKTKGVTNKRLLRHMQERDYYINQYNKPNMVDGFECAVCNIIHERHINDGDSKPLVADGSHLHCQYPRPVIKRKRTKGLHRDEIMMWRQIASLEFYHSKAVANAILKHGTLEDIKLAYNNAGNQLTSEDFKLKEEDIQ